MKKIILATIFSVLSFSLMAEDSIDNNQDIKRNSFSLGFGPAFSTYKNAMENEKLPKEVNPKFNVNLEYLRKLDILDNRLSIGFDVQSNFAKKYSYKYIDEDSYETGEIRINTPLIMNILVDFEILRLSKFTTSVQLGLGLANHYLNVESIYEDGYNDYFDSLTYLKQSPNMKIGLVVYYNIVDSFAIGVGVHYAYTGDIKFTDNVKIKNNGVTTANLKLKYSF